MKTDDNLNGSNDPFVLSGSSPPNSNQPPSSNQSGWLTAIEAAAYLRCTVKTIYNYKCSGRLNGYNLGGRKKGTLRFKKSDLDIFIYGKRGA